MSGHERLSCSACHTAWAPTCTTCHLSFEPARPQWDFTAHRQTAGSWIERSDGFGHAAPGLGVRADGRIVPAVPGMILTIDSSVSGKRSSSRRLFAPLEPHTTGRRARPCASCHRETQAFRPGDEGTRPGFLPLDVEEQMRVLAVGPCLRCHARPSDSIYRDFRRSLRGRPPRCA